MDSGCLSQEPEVLDGFISDISSASSPSPSTIQTQHRSPFSSPAPSRARVNEDVREQFADTGVVHLIMAEHIADHWSSERYKGAAAFVPLLTTKVLQMLDVQKDDIIMDIGCGGTVTLPL